MTVPFPVTVKIEPSTSDVSDSKLYSSAIHPYDTKTDHLVNFMSTVVPVGAEIDRNDCMFAELLAPEACQARSD